jgi:HD-GYP domain-containing protein (c-di-GMP phosphodiesterase class II)
MRVVHLSHDMEAIARHFSPAQALDAVRQRRDSTYDPELADLFATHGASWFERLGKSDPWDEVLSLEPRPRRILEGADLDNALEVAADFIDLKSPYMAGHSRRCAQLSADAAALLGCSDDEITTLRRAALVHEFGTTAVSNSILDKPGALTRAEFDRVEIHPMLTEQMLRRTPALAVLNPVAAAHHERPDGSGYHKRVKSELVSTCGHILATADVYVGLTTDRADRPAFSRDSAAAELRRLVITGVLDQRATNAVLEAAGHDDGVLTAQRPKGAHGLTPREVEVLRLAARGLTTGEIAGALFISPKTADHHIQHVYGKIGVSSRAAAMLWAMQNAIVA